MIILFKISDLIKSLEKSKEKYGDLKVQVLYYCDSCEEAYEISPFYTVLYEGKDRQENELLIQNLP